MPEATAVSVVRALASASGRETTASQEAHAERFVQGLFAKHNLSLPVPVVSLQHEVVEGHLADITTYHIDPRSWVKYWMAVDPAILAGAGDPGINFETFWKVYQLQHGDHELFRSGKDLRKVVPLYVHGDEGRSQKKTSYLVVSVESPIGSRERNSRPCTCSANLLASPGIPEFGSLDPALIPDSNTSPFRCMSTNYSGHSYLSRHLVFGIGGWISKKNPHVVENLLQELANNLSELFHTGVTMGGSTFFGAVAGIKGDMDFHRKYFFLDRSYANVGKRSAAGYICHSCQASNGGQYAFEDFAEEPGWAATLFQSRPWTRISALTMIPYDVNCPERSLLPDPFHVVKLGSARDLIGGTLTVLCRKGFFDYPQCSKNFPDRLVRAHSNFTLWCSVSKEHPALRSFSMQWLNMKNLMSAPWCSCKGSDSMILLRWLCWYLSLMLQQPVVDGYGELLSIMLQTCKAALGMFRLMHGHGLMLGRDCARYLYVLMMRFLRGYRLLGTKALNLRIRAFMMKPKTHSLHHLAYGIRCQLLL